jgi:ABC-type uncharacterized transport system ATPase component
MAVEDLLTDIRREAVVHTNEIVKEGLKGDYATQSKINDLERATSQQIDAFEDVTNANFMTVARDTQDIRAQIISAQQAMVAGFMGASKDAEINALKTQVAIQQQSTYLSDKIDNQAEATRALINDLKTQDLNRMLIERNAEIVEERGERRHWRHAADQGQWAALQSQIQAFGSQLSDARNSMVNFGTQLGVGQRATSNNVS